VANRKNGSLTVTSPKIPARWNYASSVKRLKAKVYKWNRVTVDLMNDLWIAHEVLTRPGTRSDLVPNETRSWNDFLEEIGLGRTTAWRWLQQYDPVERKLIEADEPKVRKQSTALAKRDPVLVLLNEIKPKLGKMDLLDRLRLIAGLVRGR